MDYEVELTYRLTGHLKENERVLATMISPRQGIYAATDQRILSLSSEKIGYRLRVHAYPDLHIVRSFEREGFWFVEFVSGGRTLAVKARTQKEAERFVEIVSRCLAEPRREMA